MFTLLKTFFSWYITVTRTANRLANYKAVYSYIFLLISFKENKTLIILAVCMETTMEYWFADCDEQ